MPNAPGRLIVVINVLVAVSITETEALLRFAVYTLLPSGVMVIAWGLMSTGTVVTTDRSAAFSTVTLFPNTFAV
ncbi:MAG: hypothetical protein E2O70_06650 [Candidatus Dadabacteria bacterium]|nr:hypothetical protein [Candidatus Dadabacteria bacterium]TDJ00023.1 MAG: hypothetical protein E2O70_06650 [Candidatus Dadabacteria bacterium]